MRIDRVLLTGATGFIGSRLAAHYVGAGATCHVLTRPGSDRHQLAPIMRDVVITEVAPDFRNLPEAVDAANPDLVVHLATAYVSEHRPADIEAMIRANLHYPTLVLEALRGHGPRHIINFGTNAQTYEGAAYRPQRFHAVTKQAFEDALEYYVDTEGWKAVTLRLFDTYGPGDPRRKILGLIQEAARSGTRLEMSPGHQKMNLVHVDDVVRAVDGAVAAIDSLEPGHHDVFEVAADGDVTLRELVSKVSRLMGVAEPVVWGALPYRPRELMTPTRTRPPVPGWSPTISLDDGLRALLGRSDE